MKTIGTGVLFLLLIGCTVTERTVTHVHITAVGAEIMLTQTGIKSTETAPEKIRSDFEEFIREYESAEKRTGDSSTILIDKSLELKQGSIVAEYRYFVPNSAQDPMNLMRKNGEILYVLDGPMQTHSLVSSNARIFRTESNTILVWPDHVRDLFWAVQDSAALAAPNNLIPLFQEWRRTSRQDAQSRPETLSEFREALARADTIGQFYLLGDAAMEAVDEGDLMTAVDFATSLLNLAPTYADNWNYGNAIHKGHIVLGRVALRNNDLASAKSHLLLAGATPGSPQLDSFGPNMVLAKELLERNERQAVLEYFDACARFWDPQFSSRKIPQWKVEVSNGMIPNFGAHLMY